MKPEQQRRYDKIFTEEFYIINHKFINNNTTQFYEFDMSGNRGLIYKITLNNTGQAFCNCHDFYEHAIRNNVVCKHICFIFVKFLKYNEQDIFNTTLFNVDKVKNICKIYNKQKIIKQKFNKYKELSDKDECPICFFIFKTDEKIVGCPDCLNAIHLECINKWLCHKKSCPICRSDIWKNYDYK